MSESSANRPLFLDGQAGMASVSIGKEDVAVIVPTHDSVATLRCCLESIRAQTQPCTLIVVDNGSMDGTHLIAEELADLVIDCGPERSAQRNAGARATVARFVGFIDSDMELSPGVVGEAVAELRTGAASVVVPEQTVGEGFWTMVRAYERSLYLGSEAIEAPRFFQREVFNSVGGFDETMTGPEDWDLSIRTRQKGPRVRIESVILHHEGRVRYFSACRKKGYYGPGLVRFSAKHGATGVFVASQRPWLRRPRALMNPLGIGLLALKVGEASAVLLVVARRQFSKQPVTARRIRKWNS